MDKSTAPFQKLFPDFSLHRYRKFLRFVPIILVAFAGYNIYINRKLTIIGGLILILAVISLFYKRSTLFLIFATYLVWDGYYTFISYTPDDLGYLITYFAVSIFSLLHFIRFQYLEQKEVNTPFASKKRISDTERLHRIESLVALCLGIFSFILTISAFANSRNFLPFEIAIGDAVSSFLTYFIIYITVISFSLGLAGWIGGYSIRLFFIVGCIVSLFVMVSDIYVYIIKI